MDDLIKKLYYGKLYPCEECGLYNRNVKKLSKEIREIREEISNHLNEKQREKLDEYDNLLANLTSEYYEAQFIEGFKIGSRIIMEIFLGRKE